MKRSDITQLYFICHINDLTSIFTHGILSHNGVRKNRLRPTPIADPVIQARRKKIVVPGTSRQLHDYANLYFNARNPMLFKRRDIHEDLCVLGIMPTILDENGVIITDGNASSDYRGFYDPRWGLTNLEKELIFAEDWTHENKYEYWRRKRCICAEVLVPKRIDPEFIQRIYVSCNTSQEKVRHLIENLPNPIKVVINGRLFFRD